MMINQYSILIVEDEYIAAEYLTRILRALGVKTIYKVPSALEALKCISEHDIDLAFMDINIKGNIDGIECAVLLNEENSIPIIFTTGYGDTKTISEAKEKNIYGYLVKPFQPSDVEATLSVALSTIERMSELMKMRNNPSTLKKSYDLGDNYLYSVETKTLTINNTNQAILTKKELELLDFLCRNNNQTISYAVIKEAVWNDENISKSTIRDMISKLKKKIPHINIENISSFGYIFKL